MTVSNAKKQARYGIERKCGKLFKVLLEKILNEWETFQT